MTNVISRSRKQSEGILKRNDVTGVTTLHGTVIRVYYGWDTIIDTVHGTQRNIFSSRKRLIRLDDKTVDAVIQRGKDWLKIPSGSVLINTTYKPF